jgi:hypothetical protein
MMQSAEANTDVVPLCGRCNLARGHLGALSGQVLDLLSGEADASLGHTQVVHELKMRKAAILSALESWEQTYTETAREAMTRGMSLPNKALLFGAAFSLLLHRVLKVVLGLTMSASPADVEALETDFYTLTETASFATEMNRVERGAMLKEPSALQTTQV